MLRLLKFALCVLFLLGEAFVCYFHPIPDDFDRYVYEAIVRGRSQPIEIVYSIVKHENQRAEASSILDSPEHLRLLEPLYTVRPLYIETIYALSTVLPVQKAINLISAASIFGIGVVVFAWTRKPLYTALLMAAYPVLVLGRFGTPDGLAALLAISALWLIEKEQKLVLGLTILFVSLGVRTDNVLLLLAVLVWLVWKKKLSTHIGGPLAILATGIVLGINYWARSYGWIVLFRFSFIGGRNPAQVPHTLTLREYATVFASSLTTIFPRTSTWVLLGLLAWFRRPTSLLPVAISAMVLHFLLFPSPEDRYFIWAYVVAGITLILAFEPYARHSSGIEVQFESDG